MKNIIYSNTIMKISGLLLMAALMTGCNGKVFETLNGGAPKDSIPPTITAVTTVNTTTIRIEYSENVASMAATFGNYIIEPAISVTAADQDPDSNGSSNIVELTLGSDMQATTYTLTASIVITDTSDNALVEPDNSFAFTGDARPSIARVSSGSDTSFDIHFSEAVDETTAETIGNYASTLDISSATATLDTSDPTIVHITGTGVQTTGTSYSVTINDVRDTSTNLIATDSKGYFIGDGPPAIASVVADSPTQLTVTFTELIDSADIAAAETATNWFIKISGVEVIDATGADVPVTGDFTTVVLTTEQQIQTAYNLSLNTGILHEASGAGDAIGTGYNIYSFQGDGIPEISSALALSPTEVKITFSEAVDKTTAETTSNYSLTTSYAGANLTVSKAVQQPAPNNNEVILTTTSQNYINYTATVTNVKDTNNNTIGGSNTTLFAGIGTDNTAPSIVSASATSLTNVSIYFNEDVDDTTSTNTSNYTLSTQSTAAITVESTSISGTSLIINFGSGSTLTLTPGGTEAASSGTFLNGDTETKIAYSMARAINEQSQNLVSAYFHNDPTDGPTVRLISKTFGSDGDITFTNTLGGGEISTSSTASGTVAVTAANRAGDNKSRVDLSVVMTGKVIYQLTINAVSDDIPPYDNLISNATSTIITTGSDEVMPQPYGIYASSASQIKVLMDEPIEIFSGAAIENFAIERGFTTIAVDSGTSDNDTLTFTYDNGETYIMTGASDPDFDAAEFDAANASTSAENITLTINADPDGPFQAHLVDSTDTIYITRRLFGVKSTGPIVYYDIDSVVASVPSDFTITAPPTVNYGFDTTGVTINPENPKEIIVSIDGSLGTNDYIMTVANVKDMTDYSNQITGGAQILLPLNSSTAPTADLTPPTLVSATSMSDTLLLLVFDEPVDSTTAQTAANYSIDPPLNLSGNPVVVTSNPTNVLITTDKMADLNYTLTVEDVEDLNSNAITSESITFAGAASISVYTGPVGNTIAGIGNLNNKAVTSMEVFNDRLYIATYNISTGVRLTEVYQSDASGVYFSMVNNPGFVPPISSATKVAETAKMMVYDSKLWAITSYSPSQPSYILNTSDASQWSYIYETVGTNTQVADLIAHDTGDNNLYLCVPNSQDEIRYWNGSTFVEIDGMAGSPQRLYSYGGRIYVGTSGGTILRSDGTDSPTTASDFITVANSADGTGMDGWVAGDANNSSITAFEVFNGYVYVGTENSVTGGQIWRTQDGLTWSKVLDLGDAASVQVTSLKRNGAFLYAGVKNETTGAEAWRSPDGVSWSQFGPDGFGLSDYTDIRSMESFQGLIYFGLENSDGGGAVFRSSN